MTYTWCRDIFGLRGGVDEFVKLFGIKHSESLGHTMWSGGMGYLRRGKRIGDGDERFESLKCPRFDRETW
jgi:hypothetical protein